MNSVPDPEDQWLPTGESYFASLTTELQRASLSVRFETYIFAPDATGRRVRDVLVSVAERGVRVSVLVDGLGANELPDDFWDPLLKAGASVVVFNPLELRRLGIRDHRKLVVIDERLAWVGGINVADEYTGDGVTHGWADCGFLLTGAPAGQLAREFDAMLAECDEIQPQTVVARLRRGIRPPARELGPHIQLLVSGPGRKANAFQKLLREDVAASAAVQFVAAYFLPGYRMRRLLRGVAQRGVRVQVLVPGRTDVPLARRAARHLYSGLLRSGVELWEYQPQVLHAKLFLANNAVYVGSSNLDTRSLHINYELMLRLTDPQQVAGGREIVAGLMRQSKRVDPRTWAASRSWIERWRDQWAYWILSRVDPYVTRWLALGPR